MHGVNLNAHQRVANEYVILTGSTLNLRCIFWSLGLLYSESFSIALCLERRLVALTTEYKNHCHAANVGFSVTIAKRVALYPNLLGRVIYEYKQISFPAP